MLDFSILAHEAGLDLNRTVAMRHTARDPRLQRILPWLVEERPDWFLAYQQVQWLAGERAMLKTDHVAAFVGLGPNEATFAGFFSVGAHRQIDEAQYRAFPGYAELMAYGIQSDREGSVLAFDLEPVRFGQEYVGRLSVAWSRGQTWTRWLDRNRFPIIEISRDSRFVGSMPFWTELTLTWAELGTLPRSWSDKLSDWRGVYFIYDTERQAGYVGSASGAENLYGRWRNYSETGHGGNRGLRGSRPEALKFSILERTSPDLEPAEVAALEATWKQRLFTREFGLNRN